MQVCFHSCKPVSRSGYIHGSDTIITFCCSFNYLAAGLFLQLIFLPVSNWQICTYYPAVIMHNNRENFTYDAGKD